MRKSEAELAKLLEKTRDENRQQLPAENLINQLPSASLPPATGSKKGGVTLSDANPQALGTATPGTDTPVSRADHVHAHGNQPGGSLHDAATTGDAGFLSVADKLVLDALPLPQYIVLDFSGALTSERRIVAGTNITLTDGGPGGNLTIDATGGGAGTVTSVGLTAPAELSVSGSPITGAGTLALSWANETANRVLAGPTTGSPGTPSFRALVAADIPSLSAIYQPLDADLTAIAALSSTGLAARTAADTWAQRSIVGTSNRLTVSNGNGVSGDPTLDISTSYVGQASITTLGTITTGIWSGSNLSESQITSLVSDLSALAAGIAASQPLDADLTAIAALGSTGLAVRTASNTWAQRSVAGTSNRLTVTNGDGVSGNPTLDIASTYAGQTTIVTLGTITSGTWNAVPIGVGVGGTGFVAYTVGDLLCASATTAFSKLSDVAIGNVLLSGGVGVAPSYGKVDLTAHVTGVLPAANLSTSGTYSPTYLGGTTPGTTTYTTQQGAWIRVGNKVTVTGTVQWSAASGTGVAQYGLPFTTANVANQNYSGSVNTSGITFSAGVPQIIILPNSASFFLQSPTTNAGQSNVNVEAAGLTIFTVTFFV